MSVCKVVRIRVSNKLWRAKEKYRLLKLVVFSGRLMYRELCKQVDGGKIGWDCPYGLADRFGMTQAEQLRRATYRLSEVATNLQELVGTSGLCPTSVVHAMNRLAFLLYRNHKRIDKLK